MSSRFCHQLLALHRKMWNRKDCAVILGSSMFAPGDALPVGVSSTCRGETWILRQGFHSVVPSWRLSFIHEACAFSTQREQVARPE